MSKIALNFPQEVIDYCKNFYSYDDATILHRFNSRAESTLKEVLPELYDMTGSVMLDIGCGIGGTTAALATATRMKEVHLIEGHVNPSQLMSFREKGLGYDPDSQPWNDVRISKVMVCANVTSDVEVHGHRSSEIDDAYKMLYLPNRIDLITSFRSWCHHYPASTYLMLVAERLAPKTGRLVVDVRTDSNNLQTLLENGFEMMAFVSQHTASEKKTRRYVFRRS